MWMPTGQNDRVLPMIQENQRVKYRRVTGPSVRFRKDAEREEQLFADAFHIQYRDVLFGNTFFKNLGGGKFEEMSDRAGLETFWPWAVVTGDFDNDGFEDVFIPSGMGYPYFYWPNALMMNNGDETFTDRAIVEGIEPPTGGIYQDRRIGGEPAARSSRSGAVADFDGEGRLDIVANNFNGPPYLFKNQFPRSNYLAFRLRGTKSNRDAIGAVVRVYTDGAILTRQVNPAGGYLSQSSRTLHFGLGQRGRIERVEITWPSGQQQTIEQPHINAAHVVEEPR
jgi:hypothetical protein